MGVDKMDEYIDPHRHHAEVAALNHEIYNLTRVIEEQQRAAMPDVRDPFDNPTEYHEYNDDYSKILPWIKMPEYEIPLEPARVERRGIKRFYNIGGWIVIIQYALANILGFVLIALIRAILVHKNPDTDVYLISSFMRGSSIIASLNMLIYLISNVGSAFLGMKLAKINPSQIIKTKGFSFGKAVQYCMIGLSIWLCCVYLANGVEDIFNKYGFSTIVDTSDVANTSMGYAIMTIYTCIVAPVTEELFFRGFLLKTFSKANQRFAVFVSAFFFGLAHGNIPQFLLAFMFGIFLAHITLKHSSIVPSIIVHIFINSYSTLISLSADDTRIAVVATLFTIAAAIVGLFLLISFRTKDKLPASTPKQSRRGIAIAKTSVSVILAVVVQVAFMLLELLSNTV